MATSERTGSTGGSRPRRIDSTSDRALNGRMPATVGAYCVTDVDRDDQRLYDHHMAVTMVPQSVHLPDVLPTDRLNDRAMPVRPLRDELRRIPVSRNVITVVLALR